MVHCTTVDSWIRYEERERERAIVCSGGVRYVSSKYARWRRG